MTAIDSTGMQALEQLVETLCGPLKHQAEFEHHVGAENICSNITEAIFRAQDIVEHRLSGRI